ncbi:ABC transporter ATP-binding protein [Falsirhodobacter sp. 20TX0035]|uniref:ABC transporter ATP-binding protein n=1 Tax=Falsirhodobacter sp. 20TX0035 TaxID=3022019 RepID=UPI00232EBBAB|nr:ATP-binding cassette domain-containing protein [Falsirhodobacter sp. 20TX0035]MDB6454980.1 ATP-binding cassette domain-containing protein [Falsirhodobacter sp. 20TX0035]
MTPLFDLRDLRVSVPGRVLLHGVSLSIPAGRMVALIGHNGSGKSTLLKTLARQMRPESGHLAFESRALAYWPARDLARRLAYLPQHTPPAEGMTVRELVALGRYPWHGALGRVTPHDRRVVEAAIAECGIGPFADRLVDTLSGGERQRAWLAMTVAQEAGCLLLDEPISALDIAHQVEVLSLVHRMCRDQGRGVIVVLHDVNMAARFCDQVIALRAGHVVMQGTPSELMTELCLAKVYGIGMEIVTQPSTGAPVAFPR